jgi:hypothetical protein
MKPNERLPPCTARTFPEKDTYQKLARDEQAELGPSTSHLRAMQILVDAIQEDIDAQKK